MRRRTRRKHRVKHITEYNKTTTETGTASCGIPPLIGAVKETSSGSDQGVVRFILTPARMASVTHFQTDSQDFGRKVGEEERPKRNWFPSGDAQENVPAFELDRQTDQTNGSNHVECLILTFNPSWCSFQNCEFDTKDSKQPLSLTRAGASSCMSGPLCPRFHVLILVIPYKRRLALLRAILCQ
jgi:hypothetical protein